jgi:hypothetical protein
MTVWAAGYLGFCWGMVVAFVIAARLVGRIK